MRRTLVSVKGFTAPRSSGTAADATAAEAVVPESRTRASKTTHRETPKKGAGVAAALGSGTATPRHSTIGNMSSRKRPRSSTTAAEGTVASTLAREETALGPSSLATARGDDVSSHPGASQSQKAKRKAKSRGEKTRDRDSGHEDSADDDDDNATARSRRLHNGDIIALAPPPPKNLAQPCAPRGLHHPDGRGARRQVVYPDPVIPSTSWLGGLDAASSVCASAASNTTMTAAPPTLLAPINTAHVEHAQDDGGRLVPALWTAHLEAMHEQLPIFHESLDAACTSPVTRERLREPVTPARAVIYPANGTALSATMSAALGDASPEAIPPSHRSDDAFPVRVATPSPSVACGFAFADVIASSESTNSQSLVGSVPSPTDVQLTLRASRPSGHPPPSRQPDPRADSQPTTAMESGSHTSPATSSAHSAVAVHQRPFLQAMLDAAADTPPAPSSTESEGPARVLLWEPALAAAPPSLPNPRRRTIVTLARPVPPTTPPVEHCGPVDATAAAAQVAPVIIPTATTSATASAPEPDEATTLAYARAVPNTVPVPPPSLAAQTSLAHAAAETVREASSGYNRSGGAAPVAEILPQAVRHDSEESAELFADCEGDETTGEGQRKNHNPLDTAHTTSRAPETATINQSAANEEADEDAHNEALDREVEEDLRLSEDLPFTPSGFYASSPFAAQRLTQEDDAGEEEKSSAVHFQEELLARMEVRTTESAGSTAKGLLAEVASPSSQSSFVPGTPTTAVPTPVVPPRLPSPPPPPPLSPPSPPSEEVVEGLASAQASHRLFDPDALLFSTTAGTSHSSPNERASAPVSTGTRTRFRFAPALADTTAVHPVPSSPSPSSKTPYGDLPHLAGNEEATEHAKEKEPAPPHTMTSTAGLTPEQAHPATHRNEGETLMLPVAGLDSVISSTEHAPDDARTALPAHASPLRSSAERSRKDVASHDINVVSGASRPKRTLFSFGAAPPPPHSPLPTTERSRSAPPQEPHGARPRSGSAVAAAVVASFVRHTPSPVRSMAAASHNEPAVISMISAEPTEMFTDNGDSVSVPLPLPTENPPMVPPPENSPNAVPAAAENGAAPTPTAAEDDPCYGLPPAALSLFLRQRRIRAFYVWQHEVLTSADLLQGRNYVYSLPTSGGKTLVAEVCLLRCLLNRQQSCFFVLPFVSLAEEKTAALQPLGDAFGFRVEGHYGFTGRFALPAGPTVYVCTIEKANSVLSYLLEEGRAVPELGLVVVDELHMLGESRRGATLEVFLSKLLLLRAQQERQPPPPQPSHAATSTCARVQIVGMSATVPNLSTIAHWLDASCYEGTYRPVPLHQYSVVDGMVLLDGEHNERNLSGRNEVEQLLELATEVPDCSVLVFCASRQQCVDTAKGIVRYMQQTTMLRTAAETLPETTGAGSSDRSASRLVDASPHPPPSASPSTSTPLSRGVALGAQPPQTAAALHTVLNELLSLSYGQADQLGDLVPYGVAYHHGGLLAEERELIEGAYRDRHLRILCCTSTLAAGVNLPARRVIFKSPYTGREFLTKSRYLQMCGRAGRAGLDPYGESFLVLNRRDRQRGLRLMQQPLEPCESQLLEEYSQFVRALLECISVGLVTCRPDGVQAWGRSLFCSHCLGALDVQSTADLWRQHGQLWRPQQAHALSTLPLPSSSSALDGQGDRTSVLPALTATEEVLPTEPVPSAVRGVASPSAVRFALPGVAPVTKTSLSASEERALRAAFKANPLPFLHVVLEAALAELLTHGFITLTACPSPSAAALSTPTAPAATTTTVVAAAPCTAATKQRIEATPFGISSVRSCFSVESALLVRRELDEMLHMGLILADDLHLCYFLTPLREIPEDCDWVLYRSILARLSDSRQRIASLIGLDEFYIDQRAMGLANPKSHLAASEETRRQSFTARRFWVALILADVLAEVPMADVVARYGVNRGMLQDVMRSASMFSSSITSFCHAMGWYSLEAVLASFVKRLGFGVKPDIVPLMDIRGVQPSRARALWNAGYKDPARVAAADPDDMVTRVKASNPPDSKSAKFFTKRSALMVIREASLLLENQIREKRGELKELTARSAL